MKELENTIATENAQQLVPYATQEQLHTDMLQVDIYSQMIQSPAFNNMLMAIESQVKVANVLLDEFRADKENFVNNRDEDEIDELIKTVKETLDVSSKVKQSRLEMKKRFDTVRDNVLSEFDHAINSYQFEELVKANADLSQLKKDVKQTRKNKRWSELEEEFNQTKTIYPIIEKLAPNLLDFNLFKLRYPKMVSGAKTAKLKKKDFVKVREILAQWASDLELIQTNDWKLEPNFLNELLQLYISNPESVTITTNAQKIKEKQDYQNELIRKRIEEQKAAEERQKRLLEERKKKEELMKQQMALEKQQALAKDKTASQVQTVPPETPKQPQPSQQTKNTGYQGKYVNTVNYILANPFYSQLNTNPVAKLAVLYDLINNTQQTNGYVALDTKNDPTEVLALIDYILHV